MKNHYMKTTYFALVILLAVFGFVFLGTEYLFDDRLADLVGPKEVVFAQGYVLGASVLGYLLYYLVQKIENNKVLYRSVFVCSVMLYIACVMLIIYGKSYGNILSAGLICFVLLGNLGSASCYCVSRMIPDCRYLARVTGISYAIGIGIQFINNNFVNDFLKQSIVLIILSLVMIFILLFLPKWKRTDENRDSDNRFRNTISVRSALLLLTLIVAILTCVFSTLDNAVTLVHSDGVFNIGQWPRLFLAVSGVLAGFLYDIKDRRYMNMVMYMVALLALISLVIMGFGGSFLLGLTIFYVSAGFFAVYFTTSYMDISRYTGKPALWAGMGRAVNNVVSALISLSSVNLLLNNRMMIIIVAILMFTVLSCCM
ncbi:MAG: LuxR family transcriptional regulator, partial [Anaerobutyricum sp.]|nr:LuxR family transcriptional regulator [Anaerobutyricum sp.]